MNNKLTAAQAAAHLRALMQGMQGMRSAVAEKLYFDADPATNQVIAGLLPWVTGDKGDALLVKVGEILDAYEATGEISGSAFFNLAMVVKYLQPELRGAMEAFAGYCSFPTELPPTMAFETLR